MRGYIRHPADIPIEFQPLDSAQEQHETLSNISQDGLAFHSRVALAEGLLILIRIPLRQPPYVARARVAWCHPINGEFEVGVALLDPGDGFRSRMVEQVCHIEHYRQEVLRTEGRRLTGQQAALEWIGKFADKFPGGTDFSTTPDPITDPATH